MSTTQHTQEPSRSALTFIRDLFEKRNDIERGCVPKFSVRDGAAMLDEYTGNLHAKNARMLTALTDTKDALFIMLKINGLKPEENETMQEAIAAIAWAKINHEDALNEHTL